MAKPNVTTIGLELFQDLKKGKNRKEYGGFGKSVTFFDFKAQMCMIVHYHEVNEHALIPTHGVVYDNIS